MAMLIMFLSFSLGYNSMCMVRYTLWIWRRWAW